VNLYLAVREVQVWAVLVPCVLFVIGYTATEFRKNDPASWYILGWGVTCASAFTLTAIRLWSDAEWTRYAGIVLGFMVMVMAWWMLFTLLWVWRKRIKKGDRIDNITNDSK
jgi:high-affinity Fe2+/Pb2+ permease